MVPWFYAGCSFTLFAFFCIQEFCCLDFMILVLFTTFAITHFGIMLPRFHVPYFIYSIWILELCCLDSMFLFLFTVCAFWIMELCCLDFMILSFIYDICILHFGIMLPRFHVPCFIYGIEILQSPFWNIYVASILWSLIIYAPYLEFKVFTIR